LTARRVIADRTNVRDIVDGLIAWRAAGIRFAVATVVRTWRSAPRQPGAAMAVSEHGEVLGSVSGGCVEGAVYAAAEEVLRTGKARIEAYGVGDDDAFEVGLTCGGTIELLIQSDDALVAPDAVFEAIVSGSPVATASLPDREMVVWPSRVAGSLGRPDLDHRVAIAAAGMLAQGATGVIEQEVFVQSYVTPPRMIVFGAIDFAGAVARIGRFLGFHVTVCDARPAFATAKRFPDAHEVVIDWPHRYLRETTVDARTVLCVLTHDPKFDIPLLEVALETPARYIGVMGSRRTHEDRLSRLHEIGVPYEKIARLRAPIGLDLGARTPEETAVAIAAELIKEAWGGTGRPLSELDSPIHGQAPV
jgi:xanthine dehydrogenase accessory factor